MKKVELKQLIKEEITKLKNKPIHEGINEINKDIITKFNKKFHEKNSVPSEDPLEIYQQEISPIRSYSSDKMWTRGDGIRYKAPGEIWSEYASEFKDRKFDDSEILEQFWEYLKSMGGVKSLKISQEFSSDEPLESIQYKNMYYSYNPVDKKINFGSVSRYKNPNSVWNKM
jgi:hypothetical protein